MSNSVLKVRRLQDSAEVASLTRLLIDCVAEGASVGFMPPLSDSAANAFWSTVLAGVAAGQVVLLGAFRGDRLLGTVQLRFAQPPNQPHRADVAKLLVDPGARRAGVARALMRALEDEARAAGRWLLVLDTQTGSAADPLYRSLGWREAGIIPDFALLPDGSFTPTTVFYRRLD